jgi:ABC-type multidrug transport system fused ATPase/permease subunit
MATGVLLRAAIISAVYKRALRLTGKARGDLPNGKIVNHISTDTSRIDFAAGFFHISWTAPIQFIAIAVILLVEIGYSALPGLGFLLVALPFQTVIMKKLLAQRRQSMIWTDKRAKLLQEILGGMRIVKFMAWEIPFLNRLRAIRGMELKFVRRLLWFRSGMMAFALSLPVLAAILAFITYSLTSHGLSAPTVFTVLTLFQLIRMPLMIWPMALSSAVDAHNGLTRLAAVFEAEVINDDRIIDPNMSDGVRLEHASFSWDAAPVVEDDAMKGLKGKHAAAISGQKQAPAATKKDKKNKKEKKDKVSPAELARADISGSPAKLAEAGKAGPMGGGEPDGNPGLDEKADDPAQRVFKLKDITLSVPKGSLTAVVGPIGSGKSSLLQGLMGGECRLQPRAIQNDEQK